MAIKTVQKAWRRLRMIFSKKRTNTKEVGTDLSIPEHYETENEFSFVVANRLSEAVGERDALREEKYQIETELEVERQMSDRAQNEIDELKEEIARLRGLVESILRFADLGTCCNDRGDDDNNSKLVRKSSGTDTIAHAPVTPF